MLINSTTAKNIEKNQWLLMDPTVSSTVKAKVLWSITRSMFSWFKDELVKDWDLEQDEAESEVYLLCYQLMNKYDSSRSSVTPYLVRLTYPYINKTRRKLSKKMLQEGLYGLEPKDSLAEVETEEFYWSIPNILFENRYVGKLFTKSQKYFIYKLLMSDDDRLTQEDLAKECKMSRPTINKILKTLRKTMEENTYASSRRNRS